MMNNKGEISVGTLILVFVGIIVALALLSGSYDGIAKSTQSNVLVNGSYTLPANGACKDLVGQELLSSAIVINATNNGPVVTGINNTVSEGISTVDGLKRIRVCTTGTSINGEASSGYPIKVSYTYGGEGYADDSGSRAIIGLIILLAVIAIAIWVLVPSIREY